MTGELLRIPLLWKTQSRLEAIALPKASLQPLSPT